MRIKNKCRCNDTLCPCLEFNECRHSFYVENKIPVYRSSKNSSILTLPFKRH